MGQWFLVLIRKLQIFFLKMWLQAYSNQGNIALFCFIIILCLCKVSHLSIFNTYTHVMLKNFMYIQPNLKTWLSIKLHTNMMKHKVLVLICIVNMEICSATNYNTFRLFRTLDFQDSKAGIQHNTTLILLFHMYVVLPQTLTYSWCKFQSYSHNYSSRIKAF